MLRPTPGAPPTPEVRPWKRLTAMAMAMSDSVTVSIGEEIRGVFKVIFRVRAEVRSCKAGG